MRSDLARRRGGKAGRWHAWGLLLPFLLLSNLLRAEYWRWSDSLPSGLQFLLQYAGMSLVWYWLHQETDGKRFPMDMGMFLMMAGWIVLPYYLWKAQRWRGFGKVAVLGIVWIATYLLGIGFWWLAEG